MREQTLTTYSYSLDSISEGKLTRLGAGLISQGVSNSIGKWETVEEMGVVFTEVPIGGSILSIGEGGRLSIMDWTNEGTRYIGYGSRSKHGQITKQLWQDTTGELVEPTEGMVNLMHTWS